MKHIFYTASVFCLLVGCLRAEDDSDFFVDLKPGNGGMTRVAFAPDGKKIVTPYAGNTLRTWDAESGKHLQEFVGHAGMVRSVAYSSDGKKILSLGMDQTVRIWDAESGKELHKLDTEQDMSFGEAAFAPDGKKVLTTSPRDTNVRIWDAETGKVLQKLDRITARIWRSSFSPDGKKVLTTSNDRAIYIWDTESGEVLHELDGHEMWIYSADFSPDGKKIVSASQDKTARIWDVETGKTLQILKGHGNGIWTAAWSPDSKNVVTSGYGEGVRVQVDGQNVQKNPGHSCRIWDAESGSANFGQELQQLEGHLRRVSYVAFLPGGKNIITEGEDRTVRIWDVESGKELHNLKSNSGSIDFHGDFSVDGKKLALIEGMGMSVRIWNLTYLTLPLVSPIIRDL